MNEIVVVGGGLAAVRSAEALRAHGFQGSITLLCGEDRTPYDRPALSKSLLTGSTEPSDTHFSTPEHYESLDIDVRVGMAATGLDLGQKVIYTGNGELSFDGLIIATGSGPRSLPPGIISPTVRVHALRTLDDAVDLRTTLRRASSIVIIGAGFIGSEVAASARSLGLDVTLIEAAPIPLARVLSTKVGTISAHLHRAHGTRLLTGAQVTKVDGNADGCTVTLDDGQQIEADILLVSVGSFPHVDWLNGSGAVVTDGLACDSFLNAGHPDAYAAGDIVRWHNRLLDVTMRSEQWTTALEQAHVAVGNLLGVDNVGLAYRGSNYFWSDQYGVRMQSAGICNADEVLIARGDPESFSFTALYRRGDRLSGAFAMNDGGSFIRCKMLVERQATWQSALAIAEGDDFVA